LISSPSLYKQKAPLDAETPSGAEIHTAEAMRTLQPHHRLTGCGSHGTELVLDGGTVEALKLLKRLEEIEADMARLHSERSAINTALSIMGVRVEQNRPAHFPSQQESQYAIHKPFADLPLTAACLKVLSDQPGASLTKTQVEYLDSRATTGPKTESGQR